LILRAWQKWSKAFHAAARQPLLTKTAGEHHRVPEKEIDRSLYRADQKSEIQERRRNLRRIRGRTQLVCRVTDIKTVCLMAQVTLSLGEQRVTSIITADAIREMQLNNGQTAVAPIKSTEVLIILP
jgi:molybdopterin-binding protein